MKTFVHLSLTCTLLNIAFLQGCSGPQEDPRVSFCRGLAADLTGIDTARWQAAGNRIVEPEYAEVKVRSGDHLARCFYAYDAVEPGAMEHASPLLAFSTLPYEVHVDDRVLRGAPLSQAVKQQQLHWNRAMAEKIGQDTRNVLDKAYQAGKSLVE